MLKKATMLLLIVGMLLPVTGILVTTNSTSFYNVNIVKEQLHTSLCDIDWSCEPCTDTVPFWVDIHDAEKSYWGRNRKNVYVAVLDTGLLEWWPTIFHEENVAAALGKGFTHDVWWDDTINDVVFGPLYETTYILIPFGEVVTELMSPVQSLATNLVKNTSVVLPLMPSSFLY